MQMLGSYQEGVVTRVFLVVAKVPWVVAKVLQKGVVTRLLLGCFFGGC